LKKYDGYVGAVNGAYHHPVDIRWWFITDDAGEWMKKVPRKKISWYRDVDCVVVVPQDWTFKTLGYRPWEMEMNDWFKSRRCMIARWNRIEHHKKTEYLSSPGWKQRTFLTAIVWLAYQGFKKIALYGCALAGEGYYPPEMNWDWEEDRWRKERHGLLYLQHDLKKIGVEIERVSLK